MRFSTAFWPLSLLVVACGSDAQPPGAAEPAGGSGASAGASGAPTASAGTAGAGTSGGSGGSLAAGGSAGAAGASGTAHGDWWNADYAQRLSIQVDNATGTEALEAVPVLVKLDAAHFPYAAAAADGHDLRFVDVSGAVLSHEVEVWTPAGESVIWLKLPALPGPGKASVFLYFGNPQAETLPATHAAGVWSADYAGVWHFADSGKDATGKHEGGKLEATFVAGKHGQGVSFDGATQYFDLPGKAKYVSGAPAVTFSGWVNAGTQADGKGIVIGLGTEVATGHTSWTSVTCSGDGGIIGEANPDETLRAEAPSGAGTFPKGEWHYFTVVVDVAGKKVQNYKDGAPVGEAVTGGWAASAFKDLASDRAAIGAEEDHGPHWFQGSLDEIRVQTGARSPAWIAAQGHAVSGDWLSLGAAEQRP